MKIKAKWDCDLRGLVNTFLRQTRIFSFCHPVTYEVSLKRDTPDNPIPLDFSELSLEYKKILHPAGGGTEYMEEEQKRRADTRLGGRLFVEKSDRFLIELRLFGLYSIS